MADTFLPLPARVLRDTAGFGEQVRRLRAGELAPDAFKAWRVPRGVYEQRTAGRFMLRIRLPGGLATPVQLVGLARLAAAHGCPRLHLTTRQDLQFHDLALDAVVAISDALPGLGLTARGTGGNTPRNVACDHLAGVAADEAFDVRPHAIATSFRLLDREGIDRLPRKFKVAFSGSSADRAGAGVADVGFIACHRSGDEGFQVLVAGGLGGRPMVALPLVGFIPATAAPGVAEALCELFAVHGDRANRSAARLRHVRARLGDEAFAALARIALQRGLAARSSLLPPIAVEPWRPASPLPAGLAPHAGLVAQREAGRFALRVAPLHGDLAPAALGAVAEAAAAFAEPAVRLDLHQALWLTGVAGGDVPAVLSRLATLGLGQAPCIPACAGAATCQLGLLRAQACADAVATRLGARADALGVRISGCANGCARHHVAAIGLEGRARRVGERLMPFYEVLVGGRHGGPQGAALGRKVGAVPAKRVPELLERLAALSERTPETVWPVVADLTMLPAEPPVDWFNDHGSDAPFTLAGRGAGECGA